MITVKVDTSQLKSFTDGVAKQVRFAASMALTMTAKKVQASIPAELDRVLDRPTEFTKRGVFVVPATKNNLRAVVGFKDRQANYMHWQIEGGTRSPTKRALRLPSAINLDAHGNIPRGTIQRLIAVARKESKLAKRTSQRIKVSNKLDLFYGDPKDIGARKYPPGIYKIVKNGAGGQLIPLIVFPKVNAKYKPRFAFAKFVGDVVEKEIQGQFNAAFSKALSSAR